MARKGNIQFTLILSVPGGLEAEADRIHKSHAAWMERTHHRDGEKALLIYDVSKAPEMENPMDPASGATGNIVYILSEVYRSPAGLQDHWQMAAESWEDFEAMKGLMGQGKVTLINGAEILHSLW